jgi:cytochrome b involved in lipid metabolism
MVLDFGDFAMYHPGGKFVLEKNVGRDITKFYYGSYSMINGLSTGRGLHIHSN